MVVYPDCRASPMTQQKRIPLPMQETWLGQISGPGRSPGAGNGNSLQYSCLEKIPWTEEPWGCRVRHDWAIKQTCTAESTPRMKEGEALQGEEWLLTGWNEFPFLNSVAQKQSCKVAPGLAGIKFLVVMNGVWFLQILLRWEVDGLQAGRL